MSICSINQPYFFPYFGYFVLIARSNTFVSLEDVAMIKRGFIHRNSIVVDQKIVNFTVPIDKISQNKKILDTYTYEFEYFFRNFSKMLELAYSNFPHYGQVEHVLNVINCDVEMKISELAEKSITSVMHVLGLEAEVLRSSNLNCLNVSGQDRIVELCTICGAREYINLPSGRALYDEAVFNESGIELSFVDIDREKYELFVGKREKFVSIIDALARYPAHQIRDALLL